MGISDAAKMLPGSVMAPQRQVRMADVVEVMVGGIGGAKRQLKFGD